MSTEDFGAAHSMDTTWFAVDRDGHVAVFDSGEPGAVPEACAAYGQYDDDAVEALTRLPETGDARLDPGALVHPGLRAGARPPRRKIPFLRPDASASDEEASYLVVDEAATAEQLASRVPGAIARPLAEHDFTVVRFSVPKDDAAAAIAAWNDVLREAYASAWLVTGWWPFGSELALSRRGVFAYRAHDDRFNAAEPYGRVLLPDAPIALDDLPPSARDVLRARPRLDVSFAADRYVQPAELVPCATWQSALYLASDGRTVRMLPGADRAAYASEASGLDADANDEMDSEFEPVVFDPPLDQG